MSAHHEYHVAMDEFFEWMAKFIPKAIVFEQVLGFEKPIHAGATTSPYQLCFGGKNLVVAAVWGNNSSQRIAQRGSLPELW